MLSTQQFPDSIDRSETLRPLERFTDLSISAAGTQSSSAEIFQRNSASQNTRETETDFAKAIKAEESGFEIERQNSLGGVERQSSLGIERQSSLGLERQNSLGIERLSSFSGFPSSFPQSGFGNGDFPSSLPSNGQMDFAASIPSESMEDKPFGSFPHSVPSTAHGMDEFPSSMPSNGPGMEQEMYMGFEEENSSKEDENRKSEPIEEDEDSCSGDPYSRKEKSLGKLCCKFLQKCGRTPDCQVNLDLMTNQMGNN